MEGISQESIAIAGHLKLNRLIVLWDDNGISIDGPLSVSDSIDQLKRFESAGWNATRVDGHDHDAIAAAITAAQSSDRPTLIACKTIIGYGAPNALYFDNRRCYNQQPTSVAAGCVTFIQDDPALDDYNADIIAAQAVEQVEALMHEQASVESLGGEEVDIIELFGAIREEKKADETASEERIREMRMRVDAALRSLVEREKEVLILRFGLLDGVERTLEEVGRYFKVTRERVRQIEMKALKKLRHPTRLRQLMELSQNEEPQSGPGFDDFAKDAE
jgi:RNA polymerase sigma factor (sigma-70 family)